MLELRDTVTDMLSTIYTDRFRAEYNQLKIRFDKLKAMVEKWDKGELNFVPTCPREIYTRQLNAMRDYIDILEERAIFEKVDL